MNHLEEAKEAARLLGLSDPNGNDLAQYAIANAQIEIAEQLKKLNEHLGKIIWIDPDNGRGMLVIDGFIGVQGISE